MKLIIFIPALNEEKTISNVILGLALYPLAYDIGNIYGVASAYVLIVLIFTYISYHYFNVAKRRAKIEANIHNS